MAKIKEEIKNNIIYVILGPTCTGKTSLALEFCKKLDGEIISFDSRQVYKYMDIGTGKIPCTDNIKITKNKDFWVVDRVKIHGYDLVTPDKYFSSYDYAEFAFNIINKLTKSNKKIFLVGGTGYYLDAVTGRVKPSNVPPNQKLRNKLNTYSLIKLQNILKKMDANIFNSIDHKNPVRLIRAIEKLSNKPSKDILNYPKNLSFELIGLTSDRDSLYERADSWVDCIWNKDFEDEVKFLLKSKYRKSDKLDGLIYKSMKSFLEGTLTQEEAKTRAKFDMHAYIRRQQTYFKKIPNIVWLDIYKDNLEKKLYNIIK